jgi:hypothetical protein
MRAALLLAMAAVLLCLCGPLSVSATVASTPNSVTINPDGSMTVDGQPFKIHGVGQSEGGEQQGMGWVCLLA